MAGARDVSTIRSEIEQARDQLASTVDQLAERLAPSRLTDQAKANAKAKLTSPAGIAAVSAVSLLLTLVIIRNLRRSRR